MTLTTEQTTLLRALVLEEAIVREAIEVDTPINATINDMQMLLVTRAESQSNPDWDRDNPAMRALIGTVQEVRAAHTSHNGWMYDHGLLRVFGAPLNPAPVNGHYYRVIEGERKRLIRYNDADHVGDRVLSHCPWSIIENNPGEAEWDDNGFQAESFGLMYVEVRSPEVGAQPTPVDLAAALLGEANPWSVGEPTVPTMLLSDPKLHDAAEPAVPGGLTALLDPEIVPGEMYLVFTDTSPVADTIVALADHAGVLQGTAQYNRYNDLYVNPYTETFRPGDNRHHVKVAVRPLDTRAAAEDREAIIGNKQLLREAKVQARNTMVELNRLALEMDWCGEYESAAKRIGIMPSGSVRRTHVPEVPELDADGNELPVGPPPPRMVKFAWDFTADFNADFEIDSPSSYTDSRIGDDLGISTETSGLRFSGSGTISLPTVVVEVDLSEVTDNGEAAARAEVNVDMVHEAINDELSNGSLEEVVSWSINDYTDVTDEQDWYDEDDYDNS